MRQIVLAAFRPATVPQPLAGDAIHLWFFPQWQGPSRGAAESASVRALLGGYTGRGPAELVFVRDAQGKPRLAGGGLEFNLSHSGQALLVALSRDQPLGVDLETPRRPRPALELAQRYFAPVEARALAALPEDARQAAFLRLWTCKEAVLKAHGGGISVGLERVTFEIGDDGSVRRLVGAAEPLAWRDWQIVKLSLGDACGALAWSGAERHVEPYMATPA